MCFYFVDGKLCYLLIRILLKRRTPPKIAAPLLILVDWIQLQHHWRQRGITDEWQNGNLHYVVWNGHTLQKCIDTRCMLTQQCFHNSDGVLSVFTFIMSPLVSLSHQQNLAQRNMCPLNSFLLETVTAASSSDPTPLSPSPPSFLPPWSITGTKVIRYREVGTGGVYRLMRSSSDMRTWSFYKIHEQKITHHTLVALPCSKWSITTCT